MSVIYHRHSAGLSLIEASPKITMSGVTRALRPAPQTGIERIMKARIVRPSELYRFLYRAQVRRSRSVRLLRLEHEG
jgi:hypothetical protein